MNKKNSSNIVRCELCTQEATLYCAADSAFLCNTCDSSVHGANFIVARHVRHLLCSNCGSLYAPGTSCDSCNPDPVDEDCLSSSSSSCSACVSITAESIEIMRRRHKKGVKSTATTGVITEDSVCSMGHVEESRTNHRHGPPCKVKYSWMTDSEGKLDRKAVEWVFRSWCRRLSGDERSSSEIISHHEHEVVVAAATRALRMCMGGGVSPMRVALAASFWVALSTTMSGRRMSPSVSVSMSLLKRLQEICGVPGRLILMMAERRVARLFRATATKQKGCHRQLLQDQEEGWGES